MINKTFVIRSNELPDEYKTMDWKEVNLDDSASHPEVPCVMVISKLSYSLVIPYQISMTQNLKEFLKDSAFVSNVRQVAYTEADKVYYVEEKSKTKRIKMRDSMQKFFKVYN